MGPANDDSYRGVSFCKAPFAGILYICSLNRDRLSDTFENF